MGEEKRARGVDREAEAEKSPRKASRLVPPPAGAAAAGSGRDEGAPPPARAAEAEAEANDTLQKQCEHVLCDLEDAEFIHDDIATSKYAPSCGQDGCGVTGRGKILVCTGCADYLCVGVVSKGKPQGHAMLHAKSHGPEHWFHLWYFNPLVGYCFFCRRNMNYCLESTDDMEEETMDDDDDAGGYAAASAADQSVQRRHNALAGYIVRGIPNMGNTCYLNALLQCLFVLGKLRERMLGPDAPTGDRGKALQWLFAKTDPAANAIKVLDPSLFLACIQIGDPSFKGFGTNHDSHELLTSLRDALDEEEKASKPPGTQGGPPGLCDSIFGGQISVTRSCKCCSVVSVSYDVFYDILLPLPSKEAPAKSVASSPMNSEKIQTIADGVDTQIPGSKLEGLSVLLPSKRESPAKSVESSPRTSPVCQRKIRINLRPAINRIKGEKAKAIAEGGDPRMPASKLEVEFKDKTSKPSEVDSTEAKQICKKDDDPGEIDEVPAKAVDSLPQNILVDVKVQGVHEPTAVSCSPPVFTSREKSKQMTSGSDVNQNDIAGLDESSTQVKEHNFPVKVTKEDKGKSWSSAIVHGDTEDVSSDVSIEDCLVHYFETEVIERSCENCAKVAEQVSTDISKDGEQTITTTNGNITVDGGHTEHSERKTSQNGQSGDLNGLAVECTSSSRQPHGPDAQHQLVLSVDRTTEGIASGKNCNESSYSTDNKKPECHEGVQEAVPDCLPTEKQTNVSNAQDSQNTSTLNQHNGKQVKLDNSAHQVELNQDELKDMSRYAIETRSFSKLPSVLIIQLKRTMKGLIKAGGHVRFEEILDVGPFMDPSSEDKDNSSYRLVGVIEHIGVFNADFDANVGHYVAYVSPSDQQQSTGPTSWFYASDKDIRQVPIEDVLKCKAYMLFYERI